MTMIQVTPLDKSSGQDIQLTIDVKTKPIGALGQLEVLAKKLQLISSQRIKNTNEFVSKEMNPRLTLANPTMLVFAADHGINEEGLSIAPSEVTRQMVLNFLHGGAAINCFCRSNDINLTVVDCGILTAVSSNEIPETATKKLSPRLVEQRLGEGTKNFAKEAAMDEVQVKQGFTFAKKLTEKLISDGIEIILLGEMGIANTSSASALMAALTPYNVEQCVGRGTGISDEQISKKIELINKALQRITPSIPLNDASLLTERQLQVLLSELGGFEIVQMVATILTAASQSIPIVIDGFIVSIAALVAVCMQANVSDYLIFSHVSKEKAHQLLLMEFKKLNSEIDPPLLDLGLRLGEGTGAALALPIIEAAASFYNDMASFTDAGVSV